MYQVIVYSRSGNTRKVADTIADKLGVAAVDVTGAKLDPDAKVVFLGSGRYGGAPGKEMQVFIEKSDLKGRKVAYFGTCGFNGLNKNREREFSTKILAGAGAVILGEYHCKGRFGIFNRGHPDNDDLDGARQFAIEMTKTV